LYQASQSTLNNASSSFITNFINQTNNAGAFPKPGHWSIFAESNSIIASVVRTSGDCAIGTVEITYQVTTIETQGVIHSLNYTATLALLNLQNAISYIQQSAVVYDNSSQTVCGIPIVTRVSLVTFSVPTQNYENVAGGQINITATSTTPTQSPSTLFQYILFDYPNNYYTGAPARIYVNDGALPPPPSGPVSGISVKTQCGLACYSNHTICPIGGQFSYRLQGSNAMYTTVNLAYNGAEIPTSPGTYEYYCTLQYSFGFSQTYYSILPIIVS
jgi:hypothetical protein